jgi:hypothetical protein
MTRAPATWVAPGIEGRLEVFVVGIDQIGNEALWRISQKAPDNGWSNWLSHGTPPGSDGLRWSPAVASGDDGRLELFVVGDDLHPDGFGSGGALYHQRQTVRNNAWSTWMSHGTPGPNVFGSPAVAPSSDGRLELFVLGDDAALWHLWQTVPGDDWSGWASRGAPPGVFLNSAPAVAAGADGLLEVFIVSQGGTVWHTWQTAPNNGWSGWLSRGTPSGVLFGSDSAPAIARAADGRLELFIVANDLALWHMGQTAPGGSWSGWNSHHAPPGLKFQRMRPAVAPGADGRLEIFVVGEDDALWHQWQTVANSCWSAWYSHGAPPEAGLMGSPAVARGADGRLDLFVMGTDGALWHRWQTPNTDWSQWYSRGTPPGFSLLPAFTTG